MNSKEKEAKEWKRFKKMGYPMPHSITVSLTREEAEAIQKLTSHRGAEPYEEIFRKISIQYEKYMKARKTQYERPWSPGDDY